MAAHRVPPDVLAVFRDEAADHLHTLTTGLQALHNDAAAAGHWAAVRRAAHTLKAAAAMVGFAAAARLTHELEHHFEPFRDGGRTATPEEIDRLQSAVAAIAADLQPALAVSHTAPDTVPVAVLHRTVDHVANATGKRVRLVVDGDRSGVPRSLLEALLHLLRNAVAHGIEAPHDRRRLGKPEAGTVTVSVATDGDGFVITVADDGRGIDPGTTADRIFDAGFSTRPAVTALSGRGVGLAAVVASVEGLGGTVGVVSVPGRGATFTLRLPAGR